MEDGLAVRSSGLIERLERKSEVIGKDDPFYWYRHLKELGKRAQTKEMVDEAVNSFSVNNPEYTILKVIAKKYLTHEVCEIAVSKNGLNLKYVPEQYRNAAMCLAAVQSNGSALRYVPEQYRDIAMCMVTVQSGGSALGDALRMDPSIPIERFPEDIRKKLEKEFPSDAFIKYEPIALETPVSTDKGMQIVSSTKEAHAYDLSTAYGSVNVIYYITDIHLENQLAKQLSDSLMLPLDSLMLSLPEIQCLILPEIQRCINKKIAELLASVPSANNTYNSILLIGGDVANSVELEALFYKQLGSVWRGKIISVLGNHELWDGDPLGFKPARPIDEIVTDYRLAIPRTTLLENELLIVYKGRRSEILDEKTILNASVEELAEACANSTFLVLGGIGFSGLNPVYNAEMGLYGAKKVSIEEDIARSKRFRAVYEKVLASAENLRVIVLTHTQMADWSDARYNPKWIYVSGHTHQNTFLLQRDGTAVFSDNQVGYKPKPWHLNSFKIDVHRYDPFRDFPDGIHQITREQYVEFNRYQGIMMYSMKWPGDVYALKHDGVYMFVLKSASGLCLLKGGNRYKLDYDIDYYFDNLPEYVRKVRCALAPYRKAISMLSDEVRAIGGDGTVHGCIVDIDWFNHVYLNPFDGKVTPYYAEDITNKLVFNDMESLLKTSPVPPQLADGGSMLTRYSSLAKEERLPILSRNVNKKWDIATVSQVVLDRSMYEPSRIMRSIQYIFDQNVVRVWNDAVLSIEDKDEFGALTGTNRLIGP